jgi:hypothetical protein
MPDLQTELAKVNAAIKEWEAEATTMTQTPQTDITMHDQFTPTGNATRDTFEFVKLNARQYTPLEVVDLMAQHGYVTSSVSSLITQMKIRGMVALDDSGRLYPLIQEFRSLHQLKPIKALTRKGRVKAKIGTVLAPQPVNTITIPSTVEAHGPIWTADNVLKNIGVAEAAKLYAELGKLFGGK